MAQRTQLDDSNNQMHEAYSCLLSNGLDGAAEALRIMVNEACRIERAQHLQAAPYERSAQRQDHANGYKPKTVLTRLGKIDFEVPQVRARAASTLGTLCITLAELWYVDRDGPQGVFLQPIAWLLARKTTPRTARARATTDRRELCRGSLAPWSAAAAPGRP